MKIAQIYNNRAHWIFESDKMPNWPPDKNGNKIELVDITDFPEIQEGWSYNENTGEFTRPAEPEIINGIVDTLENLENNLHNKDVQFQEGILNKIDVIEKANAAILLMLAERSV